jgi:hypothetical protein
MKRVFPVKNGHDAGKATSMPDENFEAIFLLNWSLPELLMGVETPIPPLR